MRKLLISIIITILFIFSYLNTNAQTKIRNENEIINLLNGEWKLQIPLVVKHKVDFDSLAHIYTIIVQEDSSGTFTHKSFNLAPYIKLKKVKEDYFICHFENKNKTSDFNCHKIKMIRKNKLIIIYSNRELKYKRVK
jgi:hypothetical protein